MTLREISSEIDDQIVTLERARAVLRAATEEVEDYKTYKYLRDEHTTLLLHASDHLFFEVLPELQKITDALEEKHKIAEQLIK